MRFTLKHEKAYEIIEKFWDKNILIGDWYTTSIAPDYNKLEKIKYGKNLCPASENVGYLPGSCPVSEKLAKETLNLPTHINISKEEAKKDNGVFKTMEVREITRKEVWEEFLAKCQEKTFLQSWNWGEFNKITGNKIWRLGAYDKEELVGLILVSKVIARRGIYLLIQHGPNICNSNLKIQIFETLFEELKKIGKEERCDFIRIAPISEKTEENEKIFSGLGFHEAPGHANAYEATWKLDLTVSEEEIMKNMRKTTRYLIRQAEKNQDIVIEKSDKLEDIEIYQKLNEKVAKRQKFVPFSSKFIKNEFEVFPGQALWIFGKYNGEVVAGALIVFWSGIGFYHQAASDSKYAKLSVPYLLQWEAIKEAKKRGCLLYDFWGFTDPVKYPKHPWAGPTLFKMGFGGRAYEYEKTKDFPLSKKYWLTYIFEKIRTLKRFGVL